MRRSVVGSVLATVLVLTGLGAVGYAVYQAGYQQGLAENAAEVVVRGGPFFFPGLFFGLIFLLFLFGFAGRMFFWTRWRGGYHGPRAWDHEPGSPMEKRLQEWHRQAHEGRPRDRSDRDDTT